MRFYILEKREDRYVLQQKERKNIVKRKTLRFIVCASMMAMTLSFSACGGSDDGAKTVETGAKTEDKTQADEADGADNADAADSADNADAADSADNADVADSDAGTATTLEELYSDPSVQSMMDSAFGAMAQDGMSVDFKATGNDLVIEIKIEDSSMVVDGMGEALETALDQQADTFKQQVKTFDDAVGQAGACTVTMRYLDPDGNLLAEKSFKAE